MGTFRDVKDAARALLGDPFQDWTKDSYLNPLVNIAYRRAIIYLKNTCTPFITSLVDIPGVPAGTTGLTDYQGKGQFLAGLLNPITIEWKRADQPITSYLYADKVALLPNITPQSPNLGGKLYYEFRAYKLWITPLMFDADFRVRGDFIPPRLTKEDQIVEIHPLMADALGFQTAALAGGERINQSYRDTWKQEAESFYDDISADLVRNEQDVVVRVGRMNRSHSNPGRYRT